MSFEAQPNPERGRWIVRLIAVGLFVNLIDRSIASYRVIAEHGFNNPALVGGPGVVTYIVFSLGILVTLVCLFLGLFLGYSWARWLSVAWLGLSTVQRVAGILSVGLAGWRNLHVPVLLAAAAFVLVFSSSVREFYRDRESRRETVSLGRVP